MFWYFTAYYSDIIAEMPETELALDELREEDIGKTLRKSQPLSDYYGDTGFDC